MFDQDPNDEAHISGADFAVMCDEMKQLRARIEVLERKLAEANARAEEYRTLIASTPNGARVADAMVARMQVLREVNDTVPLRAYSAVREWGFRMERRAEQAEQRIAESQRQEPFYEWQSSAFHWYASENEADMKYYAANGRPTRTRYSSPVVPPTVGEAVKAALEEVDERLRAAGWVAAADLCKGKE